MESDALLAIEVVYAWPEAQHVVSITVPVGTTVREAIALSGLEIRYPEIAGGRVGIFGRIVAAATTVNEGDRIELYRPLLADPKHARRRRAGATK
jgi:putative ubiquitin-RnfH superfamily antitoxin RatB of RatAB toxin-antitoxin module